MVPSWIYGLGVGVLVAAAGVSIIERPVKAVALIFAFILLHQVTK